MSSRPGPAPDQRTAGLHRSRQAIGAKGRSDAHPRRSEREVELVLMFVVCVDLAVLRAWWARVLRPRVAGRAVPW